MNNLARLRFHRRRRRSQSQSDSAANVGRTETSSVIKEEYLTNRNLSIMTNTQPESDVVDKVRPREESSIKRATTNLSSSTSSQDSYVLVSTEEMPVQLKDENWEYVGYHDIIEISQTQAATKKKKYCSPKCSVAWFLKIRRDILKNCKNRVYPVANKG